MKLYKYDGEAKRTNIINNSSTTTTTGSNTSGNLWGNQWSGGDLDSTIYTNGNIFIYGTQDDESDEPETRDEETSTPTRKPPFEQNNELLGCLVADDGLFAKRAEYDNYLYSKEIYFDVDGVRTNLIDIIMPVGSIIMFDGKKNVPKNWAICDGSNGTPNLKDKFIKGVTSTSEVGKTGGSSTHTLTTQEMPSHNHSATTTINLNINQEEPSVKSDWKDQKIVTYKETFYQVFDRGGDSHYVVETGYEDPQDKGIVEIGVEELLNSAGGVTGTATATTTIGNTGNGTAFNIEPPYYTLIYIQRVK